MRDFTKLLDHLYAERALVIGFFAGFSRFEFALINSGFCKSSSHHAAPDWPRFARLMEKHFDFQRTEEITQRGCLSSEPTPEATGSQESRAFLGD